MTPPQQCNRYDGAMPTLTLRFSDQDLTYDHLCELASTLGIPPEALVKRAIAAYTGTYGQSNITPAPKTESLAMLFEAHGLLKPRE